MRIVSTLTTALVTATLGAAPAVSGEVSDSTFELAEAGVPTATLSDDVLRRIDAGLETVIQTEDGFYVVSADPNLSGTNGNTPLNIRFVAAR